MINFADAGGTPNDPSAAAANLTLIQNLIANTSIVANPGGLDAWGAGPHLYFPPGNYHFSGPIRIRKAVRLEGSSAGTRANYNTMFTFPLNSQGLVLDSFDTDNLAYLSQSNSLSTGAGTRIEGINFRGSNNALNSAHGVLIRAFVVMRDVQVTGFGGHGIYLKADLSENRGGQASNSQFYDCGAKDNNGSGLVIEGGDANIVQVVGGDYSFNGDWGIADLSFLGCTFTGVHTTQNAQPSAGFRNGATSLVIYPAGSGQVWSIRYDSATDGGTTTPGTNENVWTRYYGDLAVDRTPPNWTSGIPVRPGGPYLTQAQTAWSVWTGCYSESNQGPSQMAGAAIVIGGDHGSGIQATNNSGTGAPTWLNAYLGEFDLKTNLRVKSLLLGQKRVRPNDSVGMKMSAASSAPVSGTLTSVTPFMEYSWLPGDIVWNQDRSPSQTGVIPPLGWRCTAGPDSFEAIPFPTTSSGIGANPTFTTVTADQFVIPSQGSISGYGGELYLRGGYVRITNAAASQTYALFTNGAPQFPTVPTTASGANAYLDAGLSNALYRSTSSLRYKSDVLDLDGKYLDRLLELRPVRYRSAAGADDPSLSHFGLIAEEVAEIEPRLVNFTYADEDYEEVIVEADAVDGETVSRTERKLKDGAERKVPDGVQYDRLTVLLLGLVKRQQSDIDSLKSQVADLADSAGSPDRPKRP